MWDNLTLEAMEHTWEDTMLVGLVKCGYNLCSNTFEKAQFYRKRFCSTRCQSRALHQLEPHTEVIRTVDAVNRLGSGMALVRFGVTSPRTQVVRWFPGLRSDLHRPAFPLPMQSFPYNLLPGTGLYNLAYYGADQKLAFQPKVRLAINLEVGDDRGVDFWNGVLYLHKELPR